MHRHRLLVLLSSLLFVVHVHAIEPADLQARARELAVDAERLAARGVTLPPGVYPAITDAVSANDNYTAEELATFAADLDGFETELELLASSPDGAGRLAMQDRSRDFRVGETVSITQTFRPSRSMAPGAALLVARHWMYPISLQNVDPNAPNFVSVSAGGAVEFSSSRVAQGGLYGGLYARHPSPVFEVAAGRLSSGDAVTIRYRNLQLPRSALNAVSLPVFVRFESNGHWFHVPGPAFAVAAGRATGLTAIAPASVAQGEETRLLLRLTDDYGNIAAGRQPSLEILVDGEFETRVDAGNDPVPVVSLNLRDLGRHRIEVRSAGGGLRSAVDVDVVARLPYRVDWMELHAHSSRSDALPSDVEATGRLVGLVDETLVVEHDACLSASAWQTRSRSSLDGFVRGAALRSGGHQVVLSRAPFEFRESPRLRFPTPGSLRSGLDPADVIMIALAEVPADPRVLDPNLLALVEIKSGSGTFEWYGNRLARRGYRVGFTGSSTAHDHQWGRPISAGRTAVMRKGDDTTFDALRAGRTWVTSGPHIFLDVVVNDADPGARVEAAESRQIRGRVRGTAPIERVELVRNGEVIATREYLHDPDSVTLKVSFESDTAPLAGQHDYPRNGREWIGFVSVSGAEVVSVDTPGFRNAERQAAAINPGERNRVDFITWTRGQPSGFLIDMESEAEDVSFEVVLSSGIEDLDFLPRTRRPAEIPPVRMVTDIAELLSGRVDRRYLVAGYEDVVTLDLVDPDREGANDVAFTFNDRRTYGDGDWYYIRVRQIDDHMAWSSPVWVGGVDAP